ncbi:MAG: serine/threonine-protein kinase [Cyanobacteria bacterium P01_A01_bin.84]
MINGELGNFWENSILCQRYEVQQQLGKKPGRRTLLAKDIESAELVVIKLLSFYSDFEWDDLKLFEREAETLKSLSHSQIPHYINYFEVNLTNFKGFALVQNYIPYPSLEDSVKSSRTFTESDVIEIAKSILEILIYLHDRHPPIIHRDIKPSNILLGERAGNSVGKVYLVDFGSVQTAANCGGATHTVVGTYGYMAPEQFGDRAVPASDIYSLGATLVYLLTGVHPADLPKEEYRIKFEDLVNLNRYFSNWLKQALEPSLEGRFDGASEALEHLDSLVGLTNQVVKKQSDLESQNNCTSESELIHSGLISKMQWQFTKPPDSKIILNKQINKLEVVIPAIASGSRLIILTNIGIAWTFFSIFWIAFALSGSYAIGLVLLILSLPIFGAAYFLLKELLLPFFSTTKLIINSRKIFMKHELVGWAYKSYHPLLRKNIHQLVYVPTHFIYNDRGDKLQVETHLVIWAGARKYTLGRDKAFIQSEKEVEWLASELSEYLDLPISTIENIPPSAPPQTLKGSG